MKVLVKQNTCECYTMDDVPPIPKFKIEFPKEKFNGMCAYYNIRTDPGLGLGFAAFCRVVCGYNACKEQLTRLWTWMPHVDMHEQTRYAANEECVLWRIMVMRG